MGIEVQFLAVGQRFEDIEVQNMDEESSKISFEIQKRTSESFFQDQNDF